MTDTNEPRGEHPPETAAETLTQTIRCRAETSDRKNETIVTAVEEFQTMVGYMGTMLPSIQEHQRSTMNTHLYHMVREEFDDAELNSNLALEAMKHAAENYLSWQELGESDERPTLGEGAFFLLGAQNYDIVPNDQGYGLKARIIPYEIEWFHLGVGKFQEELLDRVVDDNDPTNAGRAEFRLDDGELWIHLPISEDVEVYEPADVDTRVGVDLGERVIYAVAVVDESGVQEVEMEPGKEFRHHRERLNAKRKRLSEKGDLAAVRECRGERARYTEQVTHTASRRIVDIAAEHTPSVIHLEDLGDYQETAEDPIHHWPQGMIRRQVAYKATGAGIPVKMVDPTNTSVTCRHCGQVDRASREGVEFHCERCGYEVHADVNAAINIANAEL